MKNLKSKIAMIMAMVLMFVAPVNASASAYTEAEKQAALEQYAQILIDSVTYNAETGDYVFHEDAAAYFGLSSEEIALLKTIFNSMSAEDKAEFFGSPSPSPRAVQAFAAFLAGIVAGWLIEKLLDYGVSKFCATYGDYNDIIAEGCAIFN